MGLRHLIVLDNDHRVTGIITRKDITEHRLEHHWFQEGDNMQKFMNVDPMEPGVVAEGMGLLNDDVPAATVVDDRSNTSNPISAFEVQDGGFGAGSMHGTSGGFVGTTSAPPSSSGIIQSASKTREQRAMKEPKSSKR